MLKFLALRWAQHLFYSRLTSNEYEYAVISAFLSSFEFKRLYAFVVCITDDVIFN